jgi:hypothetical protein
MANVQDIDDHELVFDAAMKVYRERDEVHQGLWKNDSAYELAQLALHKAKRVELHCRSELGTPDEQVIEEAIDLINYAVFVIRKLGGPDAGDT